MVQGVRPTSAHENCETGLMAGASVQPWNQSLARRAVIDSYSPRDVPAGNATQRDLYQAGPTFNAPFVTRTEVPGGGRGRSPKLLIPLRFCGALQNRKYAPPIDMRSFSNQDSEIQALLQREPSCSQVELRIT